MMVASCGSLSLPGWGRVRIRARVRVSARAGVRARVRGRVELTVDGHRELGDDISCNK